MQPQGETIPSGCILRPNGEAPIELGYRFKPLQFLGSGSNGLVYLVHDSHTQEDVAIKLLERGPQIDHTVEREILCHRQLSGHTNIVQFKEVFLTPTHLGIAMEYVSGGTLFQRITKLGRFREDVARYFFQQLVCGVAWCHRQGVCHRDIKLENTLLAGSRTPRVKIIDFGCAKSAYINSKPNTAVGTPSYIAPEVLEVVTLGGESQQYDGEAADVWSCGVALYVMLAGAYPFQDPARPRDNRAMVQRILAVQYAVPDSLGLSPGCSALLRRIFVRDPSCRISLAEIQRDPWYRTNLPLECQGDGPLVQLQRPLQSPEDILRIVQQARQADAAPDACIEEDLMLDVQAGLDPW